MKSIDEMTLEEKVSWACGTVLIGIGEGKFRDSMVTVILAINHEAYRRGSGESKKVFAAGVKEGLKRRRK